MQVSASCPKDLRFKRRRSALRRRLGTAAGQSRIVVAPGHRPHEARCLPIRRKETSRGSAPTCSSNFRAKGYGVYVNGYTVTWSKDPAGDLVLLGAVACVLLIAVAWRICCSPGNGASASSCCARFIGAGRAGSSPAVTESPNWLTGGIGVRSQARRLCLIAIAPKDPPRLDAIRWTGASRVHGSSRDERRLWTDSALQRRGRMPDRR